MLPRYTILTIIRGCPCLAFRSDFTNLLGHNLLLRLYRPVVSLLLDQVLCKC